MSKAVARRKCKPMLESIERRDLPVAGFVGSLLGNMATSVLPYSNLGSAFRPTNRTAMLAAKGGDPFAQLSVIREADLRPGDVLVSTERALLSVGIRTMTGSPYSHASIYVGHGQIVDATKPGVTLRNLSDLTGSATRVGVIRAVGLTKAQQEKIVDTALEARGQSYNVTGLINGIRSEADPFYQLYRRLKGGGRYGLAGQVGVGLFCSELVIATYKEIGITIAPEAGDSPGTIVKYVAERPQQFQLVGRLPVGKS